MYRFPLTVPGKRRIRGSVTALMALAITFPWIATIPAAAATSGSTMTVSVCDEASLRAAIAAAAPGDTVQITCGGTITLTSAGGGPLVLAENLTIDGSPGAVTLSGGAAVGVIEVRAGVTATVQSLTIADGKSAAGGYGGILNDGTLSVVDSTFSGNTGGVVSGTSSAGIAGAGAILNHGTLRVVDSTFSGNTGSSPDALSAGVAGAIYDTVTTHLDISGSTFAGNTATGPSSAGGIYSAGSAVTVNASTFSGNSAVQVGGIFASAGSLSVTNSTFSGNASSYWAAGVGSTGALSVAGLASAAVTNSTVTGNLSVCDSNCSPDGGAGGIFTPLDGTHVTMTNTILAGNVVTAAYTDPSPDNCGPLAIIDQGGNLSDDGTCGSVTRTTTAALNLGPLADNGGPTQTVALGAGSAAIDAGSCLQPTDQRGQPRPGTGGTGCDAGAYEAQGQTDTGLTLTNVPATIVVDATGPSGATVTYTPPTAVDETGDTSPATVDCTPAPGSTFPIGTSTVTCTATDADDTPTSTMFTVIVNPVTTSLTGVSGSGSYGGTATLTATLVRGTAVLPGEPVEFAVNGTAVGAATTDASGVATLSGVGLAGIGAGSYPVAVGAVFAGDTGLAAAFGSGPLQVSRADQTITVTTAAPSSAAFGTSFTVAAVATSGLPVGYAATGSCTISGATVTISSGSGACTVTYTQAGDGDHNAATPVTETVNPAQLSQTITFNRLPDATYGDPSRDLTQAATASSGLPVTVTSLTTTVCAVSGATGTTVSLVGTGTCTLQADQAGDSDYAPAPAAQQSFTISPATITVALTGTQTYGSSGPTFTATVVAPAGTTLTGSPACSTVDTGSPIAAPLPAGPHTLDASSCSGMTPSDAADYRLAYTGGVFTVTRAALTLTASSPTVTYDGSVPPITPGYDGFVNGDTPASLDLAPVCTSAAPSNGTAGTYPTICTGADDPDYLTSYVPGTLTITPATIPVAVTGGQTFGSSSPTFSAGYTPPAGITLVGTTTCATVDAGTSIDATLPGGPHTLDGSSCSGLAPSDTTDYHPSYTGGAFTVQAAATSLVYTGDQTVVTGSTLTPAATLSSTAPGCLTGRTATFTLATDPTTSGSADLAAAPVIDGTATLPALSTTGWAEGVYTITASVPGTPSCVAAADQATLTVASAGDAATGGGWFTLPSSGRVNVGFVVHLVPHTTDTYAGQLLLINNGKWRLKGSLTRYVQTTGQGSASGTGDLSWWNPTLNNGLGDWAPASTGVPFTASFTPTSSAGGSKPHSTGTDDPGSFGIHIDYTPADPQPANLPNASPRDLKHGRITLS
jgi:large repetitive protein